MKATQGQRWAIPQLLQFEQYRAIDESQSDADLSERDRSLFQSLPNDLRARPRAYWQWLQRRRQLAPLDVDAGVLFQHAYRGATLVMAMLGLLLGAGVCYGALYYDGTIPVNVALFLAVIVLPQIAMLVLLLLTILLSLVGKNWFAAWYRPAIAVVQWLVSKFWSAASRRNSTEAQQDQALRGEILQQAINLHRPIFANRALRLFQVMGIGFNVGVVVCMLTLLAITDRAFGWQSSLLDVAPSVAQIVTALAWPWRELWGPGVGLPTLDQIENTHIVLGAGSVELQRTDFKAWWPFLLLCVLFYGLVPRLLTWFFAVLREHWLLAKVDFAAYHHQGLWRRMQSIELSSRGRPSQHTPEPNQASTQLAGFNAVQGLVFVLRNSLQRYPAEYLAAWLPTNNPVASNNPLASNEPIDSNSDKLRAVDHLEDVQPGKGKPAYLILEGWQPPIEEMLAELVALAGKLQQQGSDLHLLLLGKPGGAGSKPITERLAEVWRKKLDHFQQANIIVHADLAATESELHE